MIRLICMTLIFLAAPACGVIKPVKCLKDTPDRELTCADIRAERERVAVPGEDIAQNSCPSTIGTFNGSPVEEQYFCSDVCPDAGGILIVFQDVDAEECLEMGQDPWYDPAWGGYLGCRPACDETGEVE